MSVPGFVNHWCQWAYESGTFLAISSGTNIKHITAVRVLDVPVALPPEAEQRRIAAELDALADLTTRLQAEIGRTRMFRAVLLVALLSQAIEIPESYDELLDDAMEVSA